MPTQTKKLWRSATPEESTLRCIFHSTSKESRRPIQARNMSIIRLRRLSKELSSIKSVIEPLYYLITVDSIRRRNNNVKRSRAPSKKEARSQDSRYQPRRFIIWVSKARCISRITLLWPTKSTKINRVSAQLGHKPPISDLFNHSKRIMAPRSLILTWCILALPALKKAQDSKNIKTLITLHWRLLSTTRV